VCALQSQPSKMATVGEQMQISNHTIDKVTRAKVTLENYYSNLISQHEERETRYGLSFVTKIEVATLKGPGFDS